MVEKLLTLKEAGAALGLSPLTLRTWARRGRLPVVRLGTRRLRVRPEDLAELVRRNRIPARGDGR